MFFTLLLILSFGNLTPLKAQVSVTGNNDVGTPTTDYLGWDNTMTGISLKIKTTTNDPITFHTNTVTNTGFGNTRMRIFSHDINSVDYTRIGINILGASPVTNPRSILHLGMNYLPIPGARGAWREWMNVGTFCDVGSDFCYFGLADNPTDTTVALGSSDRTDAVVVWGDNLNGPEGADNLRFIFTSGYLNGGTTGFSNRWNSAEVGRFTPGGRLGIGNFSRTGNTYPNGGNGSGIQPLRRLEIYDEHVDSVYLSAAPQLRLTYTPNSNVNLGINVDFQATSLGDLFINPRSAGANRRVGINTATPGNTFEIANGTTGNSGLRFSDLNSSFTPTFSSTGKVLTVDSNGDVVLTDDQGAGSINSCAGSVNLNHIMKYSNNTGTTACQALMEEDAGGNVGIGNNAHPQVKLRVKASDAPPFTGSLYAAGITNAPTTAANLTNNIGVDITANGSVGLSACLSLHPSNSQAKNLGSETRITTNNIYAADRGHEVTIDGVTNNESIGYSVLSSAASVNSSKGLYAVISNAAVDNYGIHVKAGSGGTNPGVNNYGTYSTGEGGSVQAVGVCGYGHANETLNYGVYGKAYGDLLSEDYGVYGVSENPENGYISTGVKGVALNGLYQNVGVHGVASSGANDNIAVRGDASGGIVNIAVYGEAVPSSGTVYNYGIFGLAAPGTCTNGSSGFTTCSDAAGYFAGDVYTTQNYFSSDRKLKKILQMLVIAGRS